MKAVIRVVASLLLTLMSGFEVTFLNSASDISGGIIVGTDMVIELLFPIGNCCVVERVQARCCCCNQLGAQLVSAASISRPMTNNPKCTTNTKKTFQKRLQ